VVLVLVLVLMTRKAMNENAFCIVTVERVLRLVCGLPFVAKMLLIDVPKLQQSERTIDTFWLVLCV